MIFLYKRNENGARQNLEIQFFCELPKQKPATICAAFNRLKLQFICKQQAANNLQYQRNITYSFVRHEWPVKRAA